MSIEAKIEKLTEALEANTIALRDVLAASVTTIKWEMATAAPAPEEKPTKKKTAKQEAQEERAEAIKEKTSDPTPEPEPEPETPAAEETEPTAAELVQQITEAVKNAITAPKADPNAVKTAWRAVCTKFGVEKISLLTDVSQLKEALVKAKAL